MSNTEQIVGEFIEACRGQVAMPDIDIATDYNNNREWGLALDHIMDSILEDDLAVKITALSAMVKCVVAMNGYGFEKMNKIMISIDNMNRLRLKLLSDSLMEIRMQLSRYLGSQVHADDAIRLSAHLSYALHNASDSMTEMIDKAIVAENIVGSNFSRDFIDSIQAIRNSAQQGDAPEPASPAR